MVESPTPSEPVLRTNVPTGKNGSQNGAVGKKKRRIYWYCAFFLVWVVVGAGLFFHIWENRKHYGNSFSSIEEDE